MPALATLLRRGKTALKILLLAGAVALVVYDQRFAPVSVTVHPVRRHTIANEVMGTGTLEARLRATIGPKIPGLLNTVTVDQNDAITQGQLLARLDDATLRRQTEVAQAELAAAQSTISRVDAEIAATQASAVKARENFNRIATLHQNAVVALSELEQATESRDVAEANLNRTLAARIEAERYADKADATLRFTQEQLRDTEIRAPFNGQVVRRNRHPGDVVVPGSSILDIISLEQLWVSAWIDETAMALLQVGQPVSIIFRALPDQPVQGRLARLGAETDRETREFLADVDILKLPAPWAIGQRAEVYIETDRHLDALAIPPGLIAWRNGQPGVHILAKGRAQWQPIKTGLRERHLIEVVEGLREHEQILIIPPGGRPPRDGRRLKVAQP